MREEYTAWPAWAKPGPGNVAAPYAEVVPENLTKRAPPPWGKRGGAVYRVSVRLFLFFEGKREFERLIFNRNAQHQLLWIFAAFEPHRAGNFIAGLDGSGL